MIQTLDQAFTPKWGVSSDLGLWVSAQLRRLKSWPQDLAASATDFRTFGLLFSAFRRPVMPTHPDNKYGVAPYVVQTSFPPSFGFEGLSVLLGKDIATIQADRCRAPHKLPPACTPPGTKSPRWLLSDVLAWLASHREAEATGTSRPPGRPRKKAPKTAGGLIQGGSR